MHKYVFFSFLLLSSQFFLINILYEFVFFSLLSFTCYYIKVRFFFLLLFSCFVFTIFVILFYF
jgi:hypothetical protein